MARIHRRKARREGWLNVTEPDDMVELCQMILENARRTGSWRSRGLAIVDQLEAAGGSNAEALCAVCFALGLVTAHDRLGRGLRFAAPLIAEELLKGD